MIAHLDRTAADTFELERRERQLYDPVSRRTVEPQIEMSRIRLRSYQDERPVQRRRPLEP